MSSLSTQNPGDLILADHHNQIYNLLKGVAGGADSITLISGSSIDMSACAVTSGLKPPAAAGAAPTGGGGGQIPWVRP